MKIYPEHKNNDKIIELLKRGNNLGTLTELAEERTTLKDLRVYLLDEEEEELCDLILYDKEDREEYKGFENDVLCNYRLIN